MTAAEFQAQHGRGRPTAPAVKPARYHHAPAQLETGRTRVVLDLPTGQLPALVKFLAETLQARPYA